MASATSELLLTRSPGGTLDEMRAILHPRDSRTPATQRIANQFWLNSYVRRLADFADDSISSFRLIQKAGVDALPSEVALDTLSKHLERFHRLKNVELIRAGDTPEHLASLVRDLERDAERPTAFRRIGSYQHPTTRDALLRYLKSEEECTLALGALAPVIDASCIPALRARLDDTHCGWIASELLGYLRPQDAVPELIQCSRRQPEWAQKRIAQGLVRIVPSLEQAPLLWSLYESQGHVELLEALALAGDARVRVAALEEISAGNHDALMALAWVATKKDQLLLEEHVEANTFVRHMRGVPLLTKLCVDPEAASDEDLAALLVDVKTWNQGINESAAHLAFALRRSLTVSLFSLPRWARVAETLLVWVGRSEACARGIYRGGDLHAARWNYWDIVLRELREAWRAIPA